MLDPRHKWTCGVDHFRGALFEVVLNLRSHTACADDGNRNGIGLLWRVDGRNTLGAESFHLLRVMNQWTERTNRAGTFIDRFFNHLDGALDAETEPELLSQ